MMTTITIAKDSSGMFHRIEDALDAIPLDNTTPITLLLAPGVYREKLTIQKPFVTLQGMGSSPEQTLITYDDYAFFILPDGMKRGTFRSYTCFIDTHDVAMKNLTIENASGDSLSHGQAIALYADGDRLFFENCRLLGHQDTLFTGPLPPKEYEPNGFIGPKQFAPRVNGRQYYRSCYICGDIDFIFGSATAYFENCTLESLSRNNARTADEARNIDDAKDADDARIAGTQGYVTAASTPKGQTYGYVFSHCSFTSSDCPPHSVYLGRPWRNYAKTVLLDCQLGEHIHPARFHDWNKPNAQGTLFYALWNTPAAPPAVCTLSKLSAPPATFVQALKEEQLILYSRESVLSGNDHWQPWNQVLN